MDYESIFEGHYILLEKEIISKKNLIIRDYQIKS